MKLRPAASFASFASVFCAALLAVSAAACSADVESNDAPVADSADELVASRAAGVYQHWTTDHTEGELYQLFLRPDATFFMTLKGEYGCDVYAGFVCPSSWSDGRSGDTEVRGTWHASASGLVLQPTGQGRPSAPIPMTMTVTGTTAKVEGTIVPNRHIFADLEVAALFGKPHTAKEAGLAGTWKVTSAVDKDGFQPTIRGMNVYVGTKYEHSLVFKSATKTYRDQRSDSSGRGKDDGAYLLAGAPDGTGAGMLVLDDGNIVEAVHIVSLTPTALTLDVNPEDGHRKLKATKQP